MAGMVVSASMGVMSPLLSKLTVLMGDEYKKLKGVGKQVPFLRDELSAMNAFLEKLAFMDDDEIDPLTRDWRNHVREMSYDMEDCIDDFMHNLVGEEVGFVKNIARRLKTVRARHRIANQIDELKARVVEANERRKRYELDDCRSTSTSTLVSVDPRISSLYKDVSTLIGIDGPSEEVIELLTYPDKQLKVISIVGFGGLGKTTLAKLVYDKIAVLFDCKAFISVSQKPDTTRLLQNIVSKLGIWRSAQDSSDVHDIIDILRGYLADKRYIMVVDDLWDQKSWNMISCAFPKNGNGSRVIVTTRLEDLASQTGSNHDKCVYKMKPLSDHDSRRLFFKRIFGSEDGCPSQYVEVSADILKKCGGLPLAIITIASLLACRQSRKMEEWMHIRNSLGTQGGRNNMSLEGMRHILNLSYMNLPLHLRTCLLYLGMYPEDYKIKRDDLVRQWIAEGFVIGNSRGQDLDNIANRYFNELINRSLIQPADTENGEVFSCRVHDMMLDLILTKSVEYNFMSVPSSWEDIPGRLHNCYNKIRRLSIKFDLDYEGVIESNFTTIESGAIGAILAHARSIALFSMPTDRLSLLLPSKHLRVLYLELSHHASRVDLTVISQMIQLRYLNVKSHSQRVIELPSRISGLVHLESLEIYLYPSIVRLPSDIFSLPRLSHLTVPDGTSLPDGVGNMRSLHTLRWFNLLDMDVKSIKDLGNLTNLRNLHLSYSEVDSLTTTVAVARSSSLHVDIGALVSSIAKLPNLRVLVIHNDVDGGCHGDADCLVSLCDIQARGIETLDLRGWHLSKVPRWINTHLRSLRTLKLDVEQVSTDEICLLGELPSLVDLRLHELREYRSSTTSLVFNFASRGRSLFPALESFHFWCGGDHVVFQAGVLPKLWELILVFSCEPGVIIQTPAGMEHLVSLRSINVCIIVKRVTPPADDEGHHPEETAAVPYPKEDAERALRDAAQAHPNRPSVSFRCFQ